MVWSHKRILHRCRQLWNHLLVTHSLFFSLSLPLSLFPSLLPFCLIHIMLSLSPVPMDLDVKMKAVVLGACFLIVRKEGEKEGGRGREGVREIIFTSLPLYFIRILCSLKTTRTRTTDKLRYNYTILPKIRDYSQIIMVECV